MFPSVFVNQIPV